MARVITYGPDNQTDLPVTGLGSALVKGAVLCGPDSPGNAATQNGMLKLAAGASAIPDIIGILQQAHPTAEDTTVSGTVYTTRPVDLLVPYRVVRMQYAVGSSDLITCTSAVSTTTMTVTSLEDNIDAGFIYVVSGTGAGQTNFLTASASGSATLKAAFGTSLDTTSKFIKIIPRFNRVISLSADGTSLTSQAAAGAVNAVVLNTFLVRNNLEVSMSPVSHAALTGLNGLSSLRFEADVVIRDTIPYSID